MKEKRETHPFIVLRWKSFLILESRKPISNFGKLPSDSRSGKPSSLFCKWETTFSVRQWEPSSLSVSGKPSSLSVSGKPSSLFRQWETIFSVPLMVNHLLCSVSGKPSTLFRQWEPSSLSVCGKSSSLVRPPSSLFRQWEPSSLFRQWETIFSVL